MPGGTGTTAAEIATKARFQRIQLSLTYGAEPHEQICGARLLWLTCLRKSYISRPKCSGARSSGNGYGQPFRGHSNSVAAAGFGSVKRGICGPHHFAGIGRSKAAGDTHADGDLPVIQGNADIGDRFSESVSNFISAFQSGPGKDNQKFFTSVPPQQVIATKAFCQRRGHQLQNGVSHLVAVSVINRLKVVKIAQDHAHAPTITLGAI